jgi:hypothetical protein
MKEDIKMIGTVGYKSKKQIKENIGKPFHYVETSLHGPEFKPGVWTTFVGPNAYTDRRFYGQILTDAEGNILKVK